MGTIEIVLLALGLSMDALAVAMCLGLTITNKKRSKALIIGLYFGGFQFLMPVIGYYLGTTFADQIKSFDHWVAFGLLFLVGGKMIKESIEQGDSCPNIGEPSMRFKKMLPLAIATSIDALAVGISFAFLQVNVYHASSIIGVITLVLSSIGVMLGNILGSKCKAKAELLGGIILVLIGLKIILEHLGVIHL